MNVVLWIIQAVLAVAFVLAGVMKSTQPKEKLQPNLPWVEDFSLGTIRLIGVAELLGGLGLILPAATGVAPILTPIAAACLALVMDRPRHQRVDGARTATPTLRSPSSPASRPRTHDTTPMTSLGADHKATEDYLKDSGLTYTILRNGWYIENYVTAMQQAAQSGVFMAAVGDGHVAPAGRRDFAEALAVVVTGTGHDNRTYSLASDINYTYVDLAAAMSEVTGKPVTYQPVTPEQYQGVLTGAGLDEGTAAFLAALDRNMGAGIMASTGDDLVRLIGHPTMTLTDGLRQAG